MIPSAESFQGSLPAVPFLPVLLVFSLWRIQLIASCLLYRHPSQHEAEDVASFLQVLTRVQERGGE